MEEESRPHVGMTVTDLWVMLTFGLAIVALTGTWSGAPPWAVAMALIGAAELLLMGLIFALAQRN